MKKIIAGVLASLAIGSSLYGFNLNVNSNFKNGYVYDQDFIANKASYLVSPVDVNFSDIQNKLENNESVFIYPYFGTRDKINVEFGVNILAAIKLTKTTITYYIQQEDGTWKSFNKIDEFKNALENYANKITDATKKSNFEGDYITQATSDHIIHNKLYTILTSNNSSIKVPVSVSIQQNYTNGNDVNNSIFPPQVPNNIQ